MEAGFQEPDIHCALAQTSQSRSRYLLARFSMRLSTTEGSARVEVSPRASTSLAATLRRMRRMILPDLVLGRAGANEVDALGDTSTLADPSVVDNLIENRANK